MLSLALCLTLAATAKPVVMVAYFDNVTGKPEFDVMRKGFADMIITDLVAYDGVTVVERDKLEAVMSELKLQQGAAFDPSTRQKIGKFVGARYVISGSMIGVLPEFRVDAKITDLGTNTDVASATVRGAPERLFDLEQALVLKLASVIEAKLGDNSMAAKKMKGVDVATVLAYSKGLDLEDQGKLEEARNQYSAALKLKPRFMLPRDRTELLIKKMKDAETARSSALGGDLQILARAAEEALKADFAKLSEEEQRTWLALRLMRGRLIARTLAPHLTDRDTYLRLVRKGHEAQVLSTLRALHENFEAARAEAEAFKVQRTTFNAGVNTTNLSIGLPRPLEKIVREAKLGSLSVLTLPVDHLRFVLMGSIDEGEQRYLVAPALGDLDLKLQSAMFDGTDRWIDTELKKDKAGAEWAMNYAGEVEAEALFRLGKTEEGISKLQRFLDAYPTGLHFSQVTRRIKIELGIEREHDHEELEAYPEKGLKECDYFALYKGMMSISRHRMLIKGLPALSETISEVEAACPKIKNGSWSPFYSHFAMEAARYDDCELSRQLWRKYLANGGSRSDLNGYQKNYQPWCRILPDEAPAAE